MIRRRIDCKHYIAIAITIAFAICWLWFPNALGRVIESVRDLGLSIAYYVTELCGFEGTISPTVNDYPHYPFFGFDSSTAPSVPIPETLLEFKENWSAYWRLWATWSNVAAYLRRLSDVLYYLSRFLLLALPIFVLFVLLSRRILQTENNDYGKESKSVKAFKRLSDVTYRPVKAFVSSMIEFLKAHSVYPKIWLALWFFYFNAFTIVIEFIAYYLCFIISFDVVSLYRQFYKLFLDLWTVFEFIPVWVWVIIGIIVLDIISRKQAYATLSHRERRNCGFINERGVVTTVYGVMGVGKTKLITDMGLSKEKLLRDQAFEIILECDFKFPYFPWINLENELKKATEYHVCFSVPSVRKWVNKKYRRWQKSPTSSRIFGYDHSRYGLTYDDKLKVSNIWETIEEYACAYFIYTVQSSLLVSNYSIRTDELLSDIGNFPIWDSNFFKRDSRLLDSYSRHSHILDFDMLRLGKRLLKDNPNKFAFGFGVYVISEVDKERKNDLELRNQGIRGQDEGTNQKNDLFNALLKMSRHACVVANRVFVMILCDLQRPEDWGAGGREVGEVVYIADKGEMSPALPFYSPFWTFDLIFSGLFGKFTDKYMQYRYNRSDVVLPVYAAKGLIAALKRYQDGILNTFGSSTVSLLVESGRMDGDVKERKYFIQSKKIYAKRYATDCLSGIFERYSKENTVGIGDLVEYADVLATDDELSEQNSFFQSDVHSLGE